MLPAGGIQNRFGSLFFILIYMSVMSLSSLPLWMEDRLLFIRSLLLILICMSAMSVTACCSSGHSSSPPCLSGHPMSANLL